MSHLDSDALLGEVVKPESVPPHFPAGTSSTRVLGDKDWQVSAVAVLATHLFAEGDREIPGISYAVGYRLADVHCGGDIVDIYRFDNDAVALCLADISGRGTEAAVHAALIKYGLRAYSSHGLTPEKAMRAMDRLYLENSNFEQVESFATAFFATVDPKRQILTYSSAGHEPVIIAQPMSEVELLAPTAPLIGFFEDQHHLFRQESIGLWPGSLLVVTSDGVTEARDASGELFGVERLLRCVEREREAAPVRIRDAIIDETTEFCDGRWSDDLAILVARFGEPMGVSKAHL